MRTDQPSKTDDLVVLMNHLLEAGETGLTISQIEALTRWSNRRVQGHIVALGGRVGNRKQRVERVMQTYYFAKVNPCT